MNARRFHGGFALPIVRAFEGRLQETFDTHAGEKSPGPVFDS
ncbi:MAG: hypothetical protein AAF654_06535 [Myxococcota bacterium]